MKTKLLIVALALLAGNAFAWNVTTKKDPMSGKVSAYAISPSFGALGKMSFPYSDVKSWIGFGCEGLSEWAFIGFSSGPNLANDEFLRSGHSIATIRTKYDNDITGVMFTKESGSNFLHYQHPEHNIPKLQKSNKMTIELKWYGQGKVHFQYNLAGSAKAIQKARDTCLSRKQRCGITYANNKEKCNNGSRASLIGDCEYKNWGFESGCVGPTINELREMCMQIASEEHSKCVK